MNSHKSICILIIATLIISVFSLIPSTALSQPVKSQGALNLQTTEFEQEMNRASRIESSSQAFLDKQLAGVKETHNQNYFYQDKYPYRSDSDLDLQINYLENSLLRNDRNTLSESEILQHYLSRVTESERMRNNFTYMCEDLSGCTIRLMISNLETRLNFDDRREWADNALLDQYLAEVTLSMRNDAENLNGFNDQPELLFGRETRYIITGSAGNRTQNNPVTIYTVTPPNPLRVPGSK